MSQQFAIARETDRVQYVDVFRSGEGGYAAYRIPSLIVAADGALLAFCEGRVAGKGDAGDIDVVVKRSDDGGVTWSDYTVVWNDGTNTCGNPCTVVDEESGFIWLLMTHNLGGDSEKEISAGTSTGSRAIWISSTADHGGTWSEPREITSAVKPVEWTWYATGPGCGIQLKHGDHKGRLVIPCDHNSADGKRYSHVILSDDHGRTWRVGGVTPRDQVNECEVVELVDGRLLLNMRNYDRTVKARQVAYSDDGGETWRDQRHDELLIEPICQASIRRVEWPLGDVPGLIAFSNPAHQDYRRNLTLRVSRDEGATWSKGLSLYGGSSAYSCLARLPDGDIGCLYEADEYGRIAFAHVPQVALSVTP